MLFFILKERNFNIWIAGFSTDELKTFKKSYGTEAHKQRLQLIKKSSTTAGTTATGKPNETGKEKNNKE
jgi:transcription initiation factor TFIID subunit TAF12